MFYDRLVDADDRQCFFEIVKVGAALCYHGYQVLLSSGVGEEEGEEVTYRGRDTLPVFARSRERRWTKVEVL